MSASFLSLLNETEQATHNNSHGIGTQQGPPIALIPWDVPFLEHVHAYIMQHCQENLGRATIIMPHNRPRRYLTEIFRTAATQKGPFLLPRMLTLEELRSMLLAHHHFTLQGHEDTAQPLWRTAESLDSVYLLYKAVKNLPDTASSASDFYAPADSEQQDYTHTFAHMDLATFLPWGLRLSALFEEYMHQMLPVQDMHAMQGEVSAMAAALLGALGQIHKKYLALLQEEQWSTAGLNAWRTAQYIQSLSPDAAIPPLLRPQADQNKHVFFVGFSTLTKAEDILLRAFWQQGAHICWHSDPNLASQQPQKKEKIHWACQEHSAWLQRWKAPLQLVTSATQQKPLMHFVAGYDVHSQLLALQQELQRAKAAQGEVQTESVRQKQSTAVVLTSPALLMPTLHHLPEQDFNVSMGYPLEKSSLFGLIEALLRLQEDSRNAYTQDASAHEEKPSAFCDIKEPSPEKGIQRRYHWRHILHCLRHPFVQMLPPVPNNGESQKDNSLRPILHHIESFIRQGTRFVSVQDILLSLQASQKHTRQAKATPEEIERLQEIFACLLDNFSAVHTTEHMAQALSDVCQLLLQCGKTFWQRYPLDAESLYRLMQHVVPTLRNSALSQEILPQATLFALCRQCIGAERVPFEAAPLQGLQVLGMLETRLLHFDKVLIVDATEDALPGFSNQDPLLPEALRRAIGLPGLQERERVMAHTLHRLLASAKEVHFYWQEGMQSSGLFDDKKIRSRFVDTFLWEEEQNLGHLIEHNMAPLRTLASPVHPVQKEVQRITNTPEIQQSITKMLTHGISPTKLDSYIQCPQRFIFENIYKLRPLDMVNEGDDSAGVGDLLHQVLYQAYKPWKGKDLLLADLRLQDITVLFETLLESSELKQSLPPPSLILLRMAAPVRLQRFLEAQAQQIKTGSTHIVALEKKLTATIQGLNNEIFSLSGRVDRVDRRCHTDAIKGHQKGLVVLDYKTGTLRKNNPKAWLNMDLWEGIQLWTPTADNTQEVLGMVADAFVSLQLPSYIHMCASTHNERVLDAAWVEFGGSGEEEYLFGDMPDREDFIHNRIAPLLTFVVQHMHSATEFLPRQGKHCDFCPYGALCHR